MSTDLNYNMRKLKPREGNSSAAYDDMVCCLGAELMIGAPKTHFAHLRTNSIAAHLALEEFYKEVVELADSLIEQYQGVNEKLFEFPQMTLSPIRTPEEAIVYLRELYAKASVAQASCSYSEIVNVIDEIKSLINSTKYKLIFLS